MDFGGREEDGVDAATDAVLRERDMFVISALA